MRVTAQLSPASYEPRLTPPLRINVRGISCRSAVAGAVVVAGCAAALSATRRLSIPTTLVSIVSLSPLRAHPMVSRSSLSVQAWQKTRSPHIRVSKGCGRCQLRVDQVPDGGCVGADGRGGEGAPAMARCRGRVRKGREGRQAAGGARCASRQEGTAESGLFPQGQGGGRARLKGKVIASAQAVDLGRHHPLSRGSLWKAPSLPDQVQRWVDDELQQRGSDEPPYHRGGDALHHVRTCALRPEDGHQADEDGGDGHHLRADALHGTVHDGL